MRSIYQLVAGFRSGDAISNAALQMRTVFRSWGCRSDILARPSSVGVDRRDDARDLYETVPKIKEDDIAVLHLSIGNPVNFVFRDLKCRKVIVYHNITPAHYFKVLNSSTAADLAEGRRHLAMLANAAELNIADSGYNAAELTAAGYRDAKVLPLPIDIGTFIGGAVDPNTCARLRDGHFNILFVGRLAPNKKIEDILTVMYFLLKIEPRARFIHAGSHDGLEMYTGLLRAYANTLGLTMKNFCFLGSLPQDCLNACYVSSDAFLCMSEHEGFCAPLVEAMLYKLPVLALGSTAIPETLGGAGVLFSQPPDFPLIAETVAEVLHNEPLRKAIVARQDKRLEAIRNRDLGAEMRALFEPLL